MIDNSASMYDLAYTDTTPPTTFCATQPVNQLHPPRCRLVPDRAIWQDDRHDHDINHNFTHCLLPTNAEW